MTHLRVKLKDGKLINVSCDDIDRNIFMNLLEDSSSVISYGYWVVGVGKIFDKTYYGLQGYNKLEGN